MVEGTSLLTRHTERYREFESHTLRQILNNSISVKCYGSTSVSKTESVGSTPTTGAIFWSL